MRVSAYTRVAERDAQRADPRSCRGCLGTVHEFHRYLDGAVFT